MIFDKIIVSTHFALTKKRHLDDAPASDSSEKTALTTANRCDCINKIWTMGLYVSQRE